MALFKRRSKAAQNDGAQPIDPRPGGEDATAGPTDEATESAASDETTAQDAPAAGSVPRGPFDVAEVGDRPGYVDLGALRVPGVPGMQLRMELDRSSKAIIAVNVTLGPSTLQLQAFAAPRTSGIWEDTRRQIAASIGAQGGEAKELAGPFGTELVALLPVKDSAGKVGRVPARFLGVDGPRWFLRGILRGAAIVDAKQRAMMEGYFSQVVVVRGPEPHPPSELLALRMPGQSALPTTAPGQPPAVDDILARGPEISEVR